MAVGEEVRFVSVRTEEFRILFWPPFLSGCVFVLIGFWAMVWVIDGHFPLDFEGVVVAPIGMGFVVALTAFSWQRLFPQLIIRPDALEGYDIWGLRSTATWEEMARASTFSILGLPYVRIVLSSGRRAIWFPLFVERFEEMAQLICHHAGAAHPVSRELQKMKASSDLT